MALTVQEALEMDVFQNTHIVAGHTGLGHRITWVNILEVLDEIDLLQEGDLLVTTAFGLDDNPELAKNLIWKLSKRGLAALAIQTGYYLEKVPESFIEQANIYGLPLLVLPKELGFSVLTKALLRRIVSRQVELLEYSERMHHELTQIVLENQGLETVATVLSKLTGHKILILNRWLQPLAASDPALSSYNVSLTPDEIKSNFQKDFIPIPETNLFRYDGNAHIPSMIINPIQTGRKIYGYIAVILDSDQLQEQEMIAISHGATVSTLVILKEMAIAEAEDQIRGDFLDDLLNGNFPSGETLVRRAEAVGYDLNKPFVLAIIDIDHLGTYSPNHTEKEIHDLKRELLNTVNRLLSSRGYRYMVKMKSDDILLLLQSAPNDTIGFYKRLVQFIHDELKKTLKGLTTSIGVSRIRSHLEQIPASYEEASKSLRIGKVIWKHDSISFFEELGIYRFLLSTDPEELRTFYTDNVAPLVEKDEKHHSDLVATAEVYLRHKGNIKDAAAELFIHRHTLRYRLGRIEEILSLNLEQADDRLRLQLGLIVKNLLPKS